MRVSWWNLEGKNKFTTSEKRICALDVHFKRFILQEGNIESILKLGENNNV